MVIKQTHTHTKKIDINVLNTIISSLEMTVLCLFNKKQKHCKIYMKRNHHQQIKRIPVSSTPNFAGYKGIELFEVGDGRR